MLDFVLDNGWAGKWLSSLSFLSIRYLLLAGGAFLLFYVIQRDNWFYKKIQQRNPGKEHIIREIKYSFITFLIFSTIFTGILLARDSGIFKLYREVELYGWGWFVVSIFIMIVLHDAYFYWMHRMLHIPWLFRRFHRIHHLSHNPSPWASFAFHPVEAVLEFAIAPIFFLIMPVHIVAFLTWVMYMTVMNVLGHLGYEIFPKNFTRHALGKWNNTSTHHNMHHKYSKFNYGLYFNWWDRFFGTNHPNYHAQFDVVKNRPVNKNKGTMKENASLPRQEAGMVSE